MYDAKHFASLIEAVLGYTPSEENPGEFVLNIFKKSGDKSFTLQLSVDTKNVAYVQCSFLVDEWNKHTNPDGLYILCTNNIKYRIQDYVPIKNIEAQKQLRIMASSGNWVWDTDRKLVMENEQTQEFQSCSASNVGTVREDTRYDYNDVDRTSNCAVIRQPLSVWKKMDDNISLLNITRMDKMGRYHAQDWFKMVVCDEKLQVWDQEHLWEHEEAQEPDAKRRRRVYLKEVSFVLHKQTMRQVITFMKNISRYTEKDIEWQMECSVKERNSYISFSPDPSALSPFQVFVRYS